MKQKQMNEESEKFRVITMKVLSMQLNSITIMDLVAYGGAALGMITALFQYCAGNLDFVGTLFVILISADFCIPMRLLGSFFHVAMNGMAACDRIFRLLDLDEPQKGSESFPAHADIRLNDVSFQYDTDRMIPEDVSMDIKEGTLCAIVGASGCGKSTLLKLMMRLWECDEGTITINDININTITISHLRNMESFMRQDTQMFHDSIRHNILLA